uniref:Uncharacterized protein n=1 Tax=Leersia perrieri TaxID=77586 RepID=A0A0D9XRG0_9ORYZ
MCSSPTCRSITVDDDEWRPEFGRCCMSRFGLDLDRKKHGKAYRRGEGAPAMTGNATTGSGDGKCLRRQWKNRGASGETKSLQACGNLGVG